MNAREHLASKMILVAFALCAGCGDGTTDAQACGEEPCAAEQGDSEGNAAAGGTPGDAQSHADGDSAKADSASAQGGQAGASGGGAAGAAGKGGEAGAGADAAPAPPTATLRVMTYNIQHGGTLGTKLDEVAQVITAQAPDIVGLNEVQHMMPDSGFKKEAEELAAKTGLTAQYFGCTTNCGDWSPGRYGIAMLSRYPLSERTKTFLPNQTDGSVNTDSSIEPRVLLCGTVDAPLLPALRFCTTHLTNGSSAESGTIRRLQAKAIVQELGKQAQTYGGRVVLTGDMNTNPGTEPIKTLQTIFADGWLEAGSGAGATIPSDAPTVRWDYILHGPGFGKATEAHVPDTTASDHRPVVVTLPVLP